MMPVPTAFDGYVEKPARVSSTCLVSVHRNRYSVPCEFAGQLVSTRLYPNRVCVVADDAVVAEHARSCAQVERVAPLETAPLVTAVPVKPNKDRSTISPSDNAS